MATQRRQTNRRSNGNRPNGNGNGSGSRSRREPTPEPSREYEETPDYGTLFQRSGEEAEVPRPQFSGQGVLDLETLEAIREDGGNFQIALWTLHTKTGERVYWEKGLRRFRLHIEPIYNRPEDDPDDEPYDDDDGDVPF